MGLLKYVVLQKCRYYAPSYMVPGNIRNILSALHCMNNMNGYKKHQLYGKERVSKTDTEHLQWTFLFGHQPSSCQCKLSIAELLRQVYLSPPKYEERKTTSDICFPIFLQKWGKSTWHELPRDAPTRDFK